MLRQRVLIAKALLDKVNILSVVLNSTCDNEAFVRSDGVHDKFLENTSIKIVYVRGQSESWHAKGVIAVSCSKK